MIPPLSQVSQAVAETVSASSQELPSFNFDGIDVGESQGPLTYEADPETLERYARVMGVEKCLYPTIIARHTAILKDMSFRPDALGINARMEMELFHPPAPGDKLTVEGVVVDKYVRRGKPYVVVIADCRNQDGVLIDRLRKAEIRPGSEVVAEWMTDKWNFLREQSR
jgi:3-hydroxybutyryl-CoA dehydratase